MRPASVGQPERRNKKATPRYFSAPDGGAIPVCFWNTSANAENISLPERFFDGTSHGRGAIRTDFTSTNTAPFFFCFFFPRFPPDVISCRHVLPFFLNG